ncbi:ferredoxin-NADPH reductase [Sanguibacter sp. 25GB23B1]|uniref:ferredoxin-NADPH reductase n=1 Tax=unclassified Sanguibacter TaxID=2645534 RepID=UPI0032AE862B
MSAGHARGRAVVARVSHETYGQAFGTVYVLVATNLLLVAACLPLLVPLLVVADPAGSWPFFVVMSTVVAPAFAAACAVFAELSANGSARVVRTFTSAWVRTARKAFAVGGVAALALAVLGTDLVAARSHPLGALTAPVFVVLGVLVVAASMLALVALAEDPGASLRGLALPSAYLAVRRWYLALVSLLAVALLVVLVVAKPALGLGLLSAPMLYVVWANSRYCWA